MWLDEQGIKVELPPGWSGRIFTHEGDVDSDNRPTVHIGSFAIPVDEADCGSSIIAAMASDHIFMSLIEFTPDTFLPTADPTVLLGLAPEIAADALPAPDEFGTPGIPRQVDPTRFAREAVYCDAGPADPAALQIAFTEAGRPFMLYVVIGTFASRTAMATRVNEVLATLSVSPALSAVFRASMRLEPALWYSPIEPTYLIDPYGAKWGSASGGGSGIASLARPGGEPGDTWAIEAVLDGDYDANGTCQLQFELACSIRLNPDLLGGTLENRAWPSIATSGTFRFESFAALPCFGTLQLDGDPVPLPAVIESAANDGQGAVASPCVQKVNTLVIASSLMVRYAGVPSSAPPVPVP